MTIDVLEREVLVDILCKKNDITYISLKKIYIDSGEPI